MTRLRMITAAEASVARDLVWTGLLNQDLEGTKRLLCAALGHPPVVESCMGQITCARCSAILGDTLAGSYDLKGKAVIGHDCDDCRRHIQALTPEQRFLTPTTDAEKEAEREPPRNVPSPRLIRKVFDFQVDVNREFLRQEGAHLGEHGGLLTDAEIEFMLISFSEYRTPEWTVAAILAYRVEAEVSV